MYRIVWLDPTVHNRIKLEKPFSKYLTETISIGEVEEDGNFLAIKTTINDEDVDIIVIHKALVVRVTNLMELEVGNGEQNQGNRSLAEE